MGKESDLFQRAVIALSDSDFERAEKLTKEIIDLDNKNVDAWSLLTNIHKQSGEIEQATEAAKQATNLDPKNVQNWNNLGYLYLLQGNWEEGEKCYAKAANLPNPSPTIYLNHAWALIELGKEKEAQQQLKQALEQALEDTLSETITTEERYTKLRPLLKKIK
ncbi:MAG: tetratricopeptide repeat protein [Candidatus Hermodarchaeota archaeon]